MKQNHSARSAAGHLLRRSPTDLRHHRRGAPRGTSIKLRGAFHYPAYFELILIRAARAATTKL
jgi:hypothetical protein